MTTISPSQVLRSAPQLRSLCLTGSGLVEASTLRDLTQWVPPALKQQACLLLTTSPCVQILPAIATAYPESVRHHERRLPGGLAARVRGRWGRARAKCFDNCFLFRRFLTCTRRVETPQPLAGLQWLDLSFCYGWSRLHPGLHTLRVAVFDHTAVSAARVRAGMTECTLSSHRFQMKVFFSSRIRARGCTPSP